MNASTNGKRPMRHLTTGEKVSAIQRIHGGESKASVARDIGVPESTLRGWCKNQHKLRRILMSNSLENKLTMDTLTENADSYGVKPEKRQKLEHSLSLNFVSNGKMYEDMSYKNRLGSNDFGGYNATSNLASTSSQKCDGNMIRGYGADAKQSHPPNPNISMAAISPSTSLGHLSRVSGIGSTLVNGIASNLLAQQYSNQAAVAGLANSQNNGLRTVRPKQPHSLTAAKLQQNNSTMDNIGMGVDMIDKPKKPSSALLSRDPPNEEAIMFWLKHKQMLDLNTLYSAMPPSASPNRLSPLQLKTSSMIPAAHSTPPPASSTPQTTSSTPSGTWNDIKNTKLFWQWCKLNQLSDAMMAQKLNSNNMLFKDMIGYSTSGNSVNNNINNVNKSEDLSKPEDCTKPQDLSKPENLPKPADLSKPEDCTKPENLSKPSHRSSLVDNTPELLDTINSSTPSPVSEQKYRADDIEKGQSNVRSMLDTLLCSNNSKDVEVKNERDCSELSGPEAVEHGEKFLTWLNSYSDPSITAMQVMQFKSLFERVKSSVERKNNPNSNVGSSKIRRRK